MVWWVVLFCLVGLLFFLVAVVVVSLLIVFFLRLLLSICFVSICIRCYAARVRINGEGRALSLPKKNFL